MKPTESTLRRLLAILALALATALLVTPLAWADDRPVSVQHLGLNWDGPTVNLDWRGGSYATAEGSFVGTPVAVPGDRAERTLRVRNAGPSRAIATVEIWNVQTQNSADTANQDLEKLLRLTWNIDGRRGDEPWADARAGDPTVELSFPVDKGADFPVTVGYRFPVEATGGRSGRSASSALSFDVRVSLRGATPAPPERELAFTGSDVAGVAALAACLLSAGWLVLFIARRRREDEEDATT